MVIGIFYVKSYQDESPDVRYCMSKVNGLSAYVGTAGEVEESRVEEIAMKTISAALREATKMNNLGERGRLDALIPCKKNICDPLRALSVANIGLDK